MDTTTTIDIDATSTRRASESDVLRVLADEGRRAVVAELALSSSPVDQAELLRAVSDRVAQDGNLTYRDVLIQCHHVHLPMLDDADVIDWNRDAGTVSPAERFEATATVLEAVLDAE